MEKKNRFVTMYYRDKDGVMRKVPGLRLLVIDSKPEFVYTLYTTETWSPIDLREIQKR